MCCLRENILTLRLSVGGRTDARTDGRKIFTQYSEKDKDILDKRQKAMSLISWT